MGILENERLKTDGESLWWRLVDYKTAFGKVSICNVMIIS